MTEHTTPNSRIIITRMLALQVVLAAAKLFLVMLFSFKNSHPTELQQDRHKPSCNDA